MYHVTLDVDVECRTGRILNFVPARHMALLVKSKPVLIFLSCVDKGKTNKQKGDFKIKYG